MEIIKTITTIFMVPTLKLPKGSLIANGFISGYYKDKERDVQYEDAVYILFQPKYIDKFREFLNNEYERTKSIIDDYDYPDGYVVVVYQLDPLFKPDFDLIRKGKYSKTSKEFQSLFPQKTIVTSNLGLKQEVFSLQYRVFNRTKEMIDYWEDILGIVVEKDQELWHMFYDEKETLNINKLKEHVQ
jgi:hypothetical protein